MRSMKMVAMVALLTGSVAFGASQIVYTLELGGNNHADLWEANQAPTFTQGVTSGVPVVGTQVGKPDLTWAVRVTVGGVHSGDPGNGVVPYGAANLVFDLELYDNGGNLVAVGAAPLALSGNQNQPTGPGFWSSINDGDSAGARGAITPDILANAAFAIDIHNGGDTPPTQMRTLIDPVTSPAPGPNFDYGWYPTANGRGGVDIAGTKPIVAVSDPALDGKLVGFGAGYKSYDYTSYRPGVGKLYFNTITPDFGFGAYIDDITPGQDDPLNPPAGVDEKALFEGQIRVAGLPNGTYTLKVVPSPDGNNILHGMVQWDSLTANYGGFGSFAAKANEVYPMPGNNPGMQFTVDNAPVQVDAEIVARHLFYNQSGYDGNRATIDAAPVAGVRNDDGDAVDTTKAPLMVGGGANTFASVSGYNKGLTGLVYDVKNASRAPVLGDFVFQNVGRDGNAAPVAIAPTAIAIWAGAGVGGADRVFVAFAANSVPAIPTVKAAWVKVTIGTGFGLPAAEMHWWGFAPGDTGPTAATNMLVNSTDLSNVNGNPTSPSNRSLVSDVYDIDKSSLVNSSDFSWIRGNQTSPTNGLRQLSK